MIDRKLKVRDVVSSWAIALYEPLLSTRTREQLDASFQELAATRPVWTDTWFAGVISDIVLTLPAVDPWRSLTGRIDIEGEAPLIAEGIHQVPESTGACGPKGLFGSYTDAGDLKIPTMANPALDVGLAAVAEPLDPRSAALIAFARLGWVELREAIGVLRKQAPSEIFDVCAQALRWATHRRNTYTGPDEYVVFSSFAWLYRADMEELGRPWNTAEVEATIDENKIDSGAYDLLHMEEF